MSSFLKQITKNCTVEKIVTTETDEHKLSKVKQLKNKPIQINK